MYGFTTPDVVALVFYGLCWLAYHIAVERGPRSGRSLNSTMAKQRHEWFKQTALRDNRIIDTQVMNGLQSGTAFFASTSLIAIGGTSALLQSSDRMIQVFADLPFSTETTRAALEIKIIGLAGLFAYAFFKFAWSYRLFNYGAILIGAMPARSRDGVIDEAMERAVNQAAVLNQVAGSHFNRGQRAFFFAIAYLGWFLGPLAFVLTTAGVLVVMWNRQFGRDARAFVAAGKGA